MLARGDGPVANHYLILCPKLCAHSRSTYSTAGEDKKPLKGRKEGASDVCRRNFLFYGSNGMAEGEKRGGGALGRMALLHLVLPFLERCVRAPDSSLRDSFKAAIMGSTD